jgi:Transposase IS116/IS110/IS902 family
MGGRDGVSRQHTASYSAARSAGSSSMVAQTIETAPGGGAPAAPGPTINGILAPWGGSELLAGRAGFALPGPASASCCSSAGSTSARRVRRSHTPTRGWSCSGLWSRQRASPVRWVPGPSRLCGASPLPPSSGKTQRHRLNRGGDRQGNTAHWRIAFTRMNCDPRTRASVARRTSEGLSKREILRCLKRYIAREVFQVLPRPLT